MSNVIAENLIFIVVPDYDTGYSILTNEIINAIFEQPISRDIHTPYRLASRELSHKDSVVSIGGVKVGGDNPLRVFAGPYGYFEYKELEEILGDIKDHVDGFIVAPFLYRGTPYSYQGIGEEGIKHIAEIRRQFNKPVISYIPPCDYIDVFENAGVDAFIVHSYISQSANLLLKELGKQTKPVIIENHPAMTMEELALRAEFVLEQGNFNTILCYTGKKSIDQAFERDYNINDIEWLTHNIHLPKMLNPNYFPQSLSPNRMISLASDLGYHALMLYAHHPKWSPEKASEYFRIQSFSHYSTTKLMGLLSLGKDIASKNI